MIKAVIDIVVNQTKKLTRRRVSFSPGQLTSIEMRWVNLMSALMDPPPQIPTQADQHGCHNDPVSCDPGLGHKVGGHKTGQYDQPAHQVVAN